MNRFAFSATHTADCFCGLATTGYAAPELHNLRPVVGIDGWIYHRHATDGASRGTIRLNR